MNASVLSSVAKELLALSENTTRIIVAVAGPPGSGKSTLSEQLLKAIDAESDAPCAVIVPMDGFHFDNAILEPRGWLPRKGAPHTFDLVGYTQCLQSLKSTAETGAAELPASVYVPIFDRSLELSRASAREVTPQHTIVITEGNYLLLDQPGWRDLSTLFDYALFLEVSEAVLQQRLTQRWLDHGFSDTDAIARAERNDLPNARVVTQHRLPADRVIDAAKPYD